MRNWPTVFENSSCRSNVESDWDAKTPWSHNQIRRPKSLVSRELRKLDAAP